MSFAALRGKAKELPLNPRHDMVWTQGMGDWKPAGEIEGLFQRRAAPAAVEESAAPTLAPDPYQTPREDAVAGRIQQDGWPGARRRSYLIAVVIFPFVWGLVTGLLVEFLAPNRDSGPMSIVEPVLSLVPLPVAIYFGIMRLTNLGMSGWWFLGNFVPFLNLWVGYRCFACPAGYAEHKKLDGPGIFLAIVYWLLIAIVLLAVIGLLAALFGGAGSPELQQKIHEIMQEATRTVPPP